MSSWTVAWTEFSVERGSPSTSRSFIAYEIPCGDDAGESRPLTFDLVVKGGRVVTAHDDYLADVAVRGERIAAIGSELSGELEIDAAGLYVLPGAIDGHVHMRTDRETAVYDDTFASGTVAAAFGGVTSIVDQAQVEPGLTLEVGLDRRLAEAHGECLIDYGISVNLREASRERVAEIPRIAARGCPSFKFFMTYDTYALPDEFIFAAMQATAAADGLAIVHAENDAIINELLRQNAAAGRVGGHANAAARPPAMEGEAVHRALAMARVAGARTLIYHLTTVDAVRELEAARQRGQEVFGEACLPYLILGEEALDDPVSGTSFDLSPPLRGPEHRTALWDGLTRGAIDIISTDHGPRRRRRDDEGRLFTPPGTSSIEVRLALVHTLGVVTGRLSLQRWVDACCTRPADVFGLTRKGRLLPGHDADIVLFDPARRVALSAETLHSNLDYSTYEGLSTVGFPVVTISRGEVIVADGEVRAEVGRGRFLHRQYGHA
jgi:dihydropyrimidinase